MNFNDNDSTVQSNPVGFANTLVSPYKGSKQNETKWVNMNPLTLNCQVNHKKKKQNKPITLENSQYKNARLTRWMALL